MCHLFKTVLYNNYTGITSENRFYFKFVFFVERKKSSRVLYLNIHKYTPYKYYTECDVCILIIYF